MLCPASTISSPYFLEAIRPGVPDVPDHRPERLMVGALPGDIQLGVGKIANARCEMEAQQVHQGENVIDGARRVV